MPGFTDQEKADAVASQLRMFSAYLARLEREKKLTPEQSKTGMIVCIALEEVIEDYKAKIASSG